MANRIRGKSPNVNQKRIMDACGFNPSFYLVLKVKNNSDGTDTMHIVDRDDGGEYILSYDRKSPFTTCREVG